VNEEALAHCGAVAPEEKKIIDCHLIFREQRSSFIHFVYQNSEFYVLLTLYNIADKSS
jgi:hypothetical protein